MISRVTNSGLTAAAQRNLQTAMQRLATAQDKATSLKAISRPSDDPAGTAEAMAVRAQQRAAEQHGRNVQDAKGWLSTADAALSSTTALLQKVRDLTVRGANDGALNDDGRKAIAIELEALHDSLVSAANTKYMGRSVFAGSSDTPAAFDNGLYQGAGGTVDRKVGANTVVRVDADGAAVFGSGEGSVFALVKDIAADLGNGTNVSARIGEIDARLQTVLGAQATIGTSHATVLTAESALADDKVALEGRRSLLEDADLGEAALDLKAQELAYQAALAASAKVLQPSLMDFLR